MPFYIPVFQDYLKELEKTTCLSITGHLKKSLGNVKIILLILGLKYGGI
jgi:hypothetical protein